MAERKYDFWGWATKNDLKCSDGRTIRHNAFKDCDGTTVPLVWNHQHNDPDNVLGHALLKNSDEGVKAFGYFNDLPKSQRIKSILQHGDICSLSIFANGLKQTADGDVLHGIIREVSLVLAGANPGASIEYVMAHSADEDPIAIGAEIYTGEDLVLEHSNISDQIEIVEDPTIEEAEEVEEPDEVKTETEELSHADVEEIKPEPKQVSEKEKTEKEGEEKMAEEKKEEEMTVQDVLDSMTPEQRKVCEYLVGEALASAGKDDEDEGDEEEVKHNAFDKEDTLQHDGMEEEIYSALQDAKRYGSVKESFLAHGIDADEVLVHSMTNVGDLAPEFKYIHGNDVPFVTANPNGWVSVINNGVHKTPFAKIKMAFADLTPADARARGYAKGNQKIEQIFRLLKREVAPTTIYKLQSFDRDDQVDITDIDMVAWIKKELRVKLDEERARAYIFGDGRPTSDNSKIDETKIIPVVNDTDQNLYAMAYTVTPDPNTNETLAHAIASKMVKALDDYEGSGNVTAFIRADIVSDLLLMEDKIGQRLYKGMNELASAMSVDRVVKVPASVMPADVYAVALDLQDYNVGMNRAGEISLFDDFDIDYNKMKYLMETRCSGALTLPHSAIVLKADE